MAIRIGADLDFEGLGQSIDHRYADSVKSTRDLMGAMGRDKCAEMKEEMRAEIDLC